MNPKTKRYLFIAAGLLVGAVLGFIVIPLLLAALVGGIAGGVAGALVAGFVARKGAAPEAPAEKRDEASGVTPLFDALVGANVTARTTPFPLEVTEAVERVIDGLRRALPEANGEYRSSSLTWEINRSASEYLPRLVGHYAALPAAERESRKAAALATLEGLTQAVERAEEAIRSRKDDEFAVASKFLNARFSDSL